MRFISWALCMPTYTVLFDQLNSHTCFNFLRVVIYIFFSCEFPVWVGNMSSTSSCFWRLFSRLSSCQRKRAWEWIMKTTLVESVLPVWRESPVIHQTHQESVLYQYPWQEGPNRYWWVRRANRVPGTTRELTSIIYRTLGKKGAFKKSIYVWVNGRLCKFRFSLLFIGQNLMSPSSYVSMKFMPCSRLQPQSR